MFDPALPQENTPADAVQMRSQFNGLKTLIDAIPSITNAQVDSITTLNPGDPATVGVSITGGVLHFTFASRRCYDSAWWLALLQGHAAFIALGLASLFVYRPVQFLLSLWTM